MIDSEFNLKLIDLGFIVNVSSKGNGINTTYIGTKCYMAPEILQNQPYHAFLADIFALGVILFTIYSGHPPFNIAT